MSSPSRRSILSLYRQLLRLQLKLPSDLSALGVLFVREEFKRHRNVSSDHAQAFMKEWTDFARNLDSQVCSSESDVMGKPISSKDIELLNDSQMLQLSELHKEASKPPSDT